MSEVALPYDLLVGTCDAYEDTWVPFFTLLQKYWLDAERLRIILSTEKKAFSFSNLLIESAQTNLHWHGRHKPWSQIILESLSHIKKPFVLLMLDDYFLTEHVMQNELSFFTNLMIQRPDWARIELLPQGIRRGIPDPNDPRIVFITPDEGCRVNTQAALWRKEILLSILRPHEDPWQFELRGSIRARRMPYKFARLANGWNGGKSSSIVTYLAGGGIHQGQWRKEVITLLAREGIVVDYQQRGIERSISSSQSQLSNPVIQRRKGIWRILRRDFLQVVARKLRGTWSVLLSFNSLGIGRRA